MTGDYITFSAGHLNVPNQPIIPYIEGDGIGPEIWQAARPVFDAAVKATFKGQKRVAWWGIGAGETAFKQTGSWLPDDTLKALKQAHVGIKGPLTTPVGTGHRSINVKLRQALDLYVCVRPIQYYPGTPSPLKHPENVNMVVFRENTEDIYAGIEYEYQTAALKDFLAKTKQLAKVRFPETSNFGIKPISKEGSQRFVAAAIDYTLSHGRHKITLVHKGNIMKYTEGAFKNWGYEIASENYADKVFTKQVWQQLKATESLDAANKALKQAQAQGKIYIDDIIADNFFQQALIDPKQFDVIATCNLNGDYISDDLAAEVGGIGIAPSANINYQTGYGLFEATHGTAPEFVGQNKLNPTSLILSGAMMFDYLGWPEVSLHIRAAVAKAIEHKQVTWDFAQKIADAHELSTSDYGNYLVQLIAQQK
ncbi:NADP-dependent isocitrate dehydrogenase [Agrilactobacillus fermenti]|uniref:NADP-dependent isocitrate dehydrogenase n=1 Tax=Agrilactobacillus fermenti TaxID=2586909 RepID=UPI001E2DDEFC|nr:NADP-dependent isocitrate dehydrogenase [Agrilactobacillus fermenti]MCD2256572.1 NADP-dependent isocitrate dehydrogenase [Agrilactobacillus fermenti]